MRIQPEYMSFKNRCTISSSSEFQAHQLRSQRRCFSQNALLWFEVLPDSRRFVAVLPGALLCNATRRLGDRQRVILRQRVRGSVRAVRAVWNTRVFQTETRVVADVTFGELMKHHDIVPGIPQMPPGTSLHGNKYIRLGWVNLRSNTSTPGLELATEPDRSSLLNSNRDDPTSCYLWIEPPANHHIELGLGWRHCDSTSVCGRIYTQYVTFDIKSGWKVICLAIGVCVIVL
jgi:hypothetical protein